MQAELGRDGAEEPAPPGDAPLVGFSVDLTDGYYQFRSRVMDLYFGLDLRLTAKDAGELVGAPLRVVFDDASGTDVPVDPASQVEACFLGMAMGWSWSLFFCQSAVADAMRAALKACGLPAVLAGDAQQPAAFNRSAPLMAP